MQIDDENLMKLQKSDMVGHTVTSHRVENLPFPRQLPQRQKVMENR